MSLRTAGLQLVAFPRRPRRLPGHAALAIHGLRNWFQVCRVYARAHPAQVIKDETDRDRSDGK